jgi:Alkylmercury lyase
MSDLHTATIPEILGDDRRAGDRMSGLDPAARRLYALILYRFTEGGPPDRDELSRLGLDEDALSELVERDLVALGPDGQVAVAYPFSAVPTRHQVRTADGRAYWAMCAIDALGMPYLLHQAAEIHAREPGSDLAITIAFDPAAQTLSPDPAGAAVAVARLGEGCAAACACPHINLFGSTAAAERYLAGSDLDGAILDVPAATATGRRVFGDLLDRLGAGTRQ